MHSLRVARMDVVNRILQYLKRSPRRGIWICKNSHSFITTYANTDWARCNVDRRSTIGFCTFVGDNLVTGGVKSETLLHGPLLMMNVGQWLPLQVKLFGFNLFWKIWNLACHNPHRYFVRINLLFILFQIQFFIKRQNTLKLIVILYKNKSKQMLFALLSFVVNKKLANIFTKGLLAAKFHEILSKLGSINIFAPTWGGRIGEERYLRILDYILWHDLEDIWQY